MKDEKQIAEMIEYLNNNINVERNSYFGKGCITIPLIEADKILAILQNIPNSRGHENGGEWIRYPHNSGIYCSLCKHKRRYRDIHDAFCPNCGAKMKGE